MNFLIRFLMTYFLLLVGAGLLQWVTVLLSVTSEIIVLIGALVITLSSHYKKKRKE